MQNKDEPTLKRYIVEYWETQPVHNLRRVIMEVMSDIDIHKMNTYQVEEHTTEYLDIRNTEYGDPTDFEDIEIIEDLTHEINPPDVEDIDPNAGRGK